MWRARQWRELLNLIDQLPVRCRWREAQVNDPEYARAVVETFPDQAEQHPQWREWTTEAEGLARVADLLSQIVKDHDPKHRKYRPTLRPITAIHAAYEESEARADDAFETDVFAQLGIESVV